MIIAHELLLGLYLTNESGSASKNIPYDEFQEYVRNGYISKVTGYDDNSVEAYVQAAICAQCVQKQIQAVWARIP